MNETNILVPLSIHEAGHALANWYSPEIQAVSLVSAQRGYTMSHLWRSPNGRPSTHWALIVGRMGGAAAELLSYGATYGQMSRGDVRGAVDLVERLMRLPNGPALVKATRFEPHWHVVKTFIDQIDRDYRLRSEVAHCLSNACHHAISTLTAHKTQFERLQVELRYGDLGEDELVRLLGPRPWANDPPT